MAAKAKPDVIAWIHNLPITPITKKIMLIMWAEEFNVKLFAADYLAAGAEQPSIGEQAVS